MPGDFYRDKPNRYDHDKQVWTPRDNFRDCRRKKVVCGKGYEGHYVAWLKKPIEKRQGATEIEYKARIRIAHAHFIIGKDQGRHVDCLTKNEIWIPESQLTFNPRIPPTFVPDWYLEGSA